MKKILFLCTGNSCRSQMAEAWAKHLLAGKVDAYSAGIETHGLNPHAVKVMNEVGIDMSRQASKTAQSLKHLQFDVVFTVCGHAQENCPVWLGSAQHIHVGFDDPPKLAATAETEAEGLVHYRRVRDEIRTFVNHLHEHMADSLDD